MLSRKLFPAPSLRLAEYILDPSTLVSYVVAIGLLYALRKQGVGRPSIALIAVVEALFHNLLWRVLPSSFGTVVVLWVILTIYEYILGPRITLRNNAVLLSGDSYVEVVMQQTTGLSFEMKKDDKGQFCVLSNLCFTAFRGSLWFKQIEVDERFCLEDVISVTEGCSFEILKRFRSVGIQRDRLISFTLDAEHIIVVLVSETKTERDQWMAALHQILGTQIVDIRSAWLSKIMLSHSMCSLEADTKVSFESALDILSKAGRPYDRRYAHGMFKRIMKSNLKWKFTGSSTMNKDELYSFFSYAEHRPEFAEIYNRLIDQRQGKTTMNRTRFHEFVLNEQKEDVSKETIRKWILKSEPILRCLNLSHVGFSNYLLDEAQSIFSHDCKSVYQDMNQPLSHYFISTSHNTYLTKDQLTSKSSVESYINALKRGCKCVELDIWDGTSSEPVVYHGYTLTSKIFLKDVLQAIKDYAFCVSPYPVILSFENHCSTEQQKVVARYLREILGDLLYTKAIPEAETQLPSPAQLQGYIIVKGKKLKFGFEEVDEDLEDEIFCDEELPEDLENLLIPSDDKLNVDNGSVKGYDVLSLRSENDEDEFTAKESIQEMRIKTHSNLIKIKEDLAKMKNSSKNKEAVKKLAKEFSDLVVYCQAIAFKGFDFTTQNSKHYEMVSLAERRALKLAKEDPVALMRFNKRQLCRIYPSGARIDSSNYDPVAMWNVGCQMVALNYQTPCIEMQLNQALFSDNGGCGYVLKPPLLTDLADFDPRKLTDNFEILKIRVISGFQIPYKNEKILKSERSLSVQIRIFGHDSDVQCVRTKIVKNNGLNPVWNEDVVFRVHVPDLAFINFTVLTKDVYSGNYALPVRCMRQGYRRVPLLNKFSEAEPYSHLFIHISISS